MVSVSFFLLAASVPWTFGDPWGQDCVGTDPTANGGALIQTRIPTISSALLEESARDSSHEAGEAAQRLMGELAPPKLGTQLLQAGEMAGEGSGELLIGDTCSTTDGDTCIFPFRYEEVTFHSCATVDNDRDWCCTKIHNNGACMKGQWGNCGASCDKKCATTGGATCVFPFKYEEVTYNSCTSADSAQPWCYTEVDTNSVGVKGKFDFCESSCFTKNPDAEVAANKLGIVLPSNQAELFFDNAWSPYVGAHCKLLKLEPIWGTFFNSVMKMMTKIDVPDFVMSVDRYKESLLWITNIWYILGYENDKVRIVRFNENENDLCIARFLTGDTTSGKAEVGSKFSWTMTGYHGQAQMGKFQVEFEVTKAAP